MQGRAKAKGVRHAGDAVFHASLAGQSSMACGAYPREHAHTCTHAYLCMCRNKKRAEDKASRPRKPRQKPSQTPGKAAATAQISEDLEDYY